MSLNCRFSRMRLIIQSTLVTVSNWHCHPRLNCHGADNWSGQQKWGTMNEQTNERTSCKPLLVGPRVTFWVCASKQSTCLAWFQVEPSHNIVHPGLTKPLRSRSPSARYTSFMVTNISAENLPILSYSIFHTCLSQTKHEAPTNQTTAQRRLWHHDKADGTFFTRPDTIYVPRWGSMLWSHDTHRGNTNKNLVWGRCSQTCQSGFSLLFNKLLQV